MAEISSSDFHEPPKKVSRGTFVKGAAAVAVGVVGANEALKELRGREIVTREGRFVPLYEIHHAGITPNQVPSDINGFFREFNYWGGPFEQHPYKILHEKANFDNFEQVDVFPPGILQKIVNEGADIILGDVNFPGTSEDTIDYTLKVMAGEAVAGIAAGLASSHIDTKDNPTTRRRFLKNALKAAGVFGVSPTIGLLGQLTYATDVDAAERIATRLDALQQNFHPEMARQVLGSAIMASKLLAVAEDMKERLGNKPKIAFQVGSAHANMEDFLQAGKGVCEKVISLYPDSLLQQIAELNNGVEDTSSALILSLPKGIDVNTFTADNIQTRRVRDDGLANALSARHL